MFVKSGIMANENNVVDNIVEGTEHLDEDSIELVGVADVEKSIEDEADDAEAQLRTKLKLKRPWPKTKLKSPRPQLRTKLKLKRP
jgi:hypothetical protein